jgi:hypothetical protein
MSFASDIKAVTKTANAAAISGRTRIQGIYYTCTGTGSSFDLRNGAADTATSLINIVTPAAAGAYDIMFPDNGVLFDSGVYFDKNDANVTSVTLLFCGGAAA